ncbi:MAG TPA: RNA ligase family protein [Candidatus Nanoarchaeia archaeon]|nr:RNA ligase family protein [Candidatus Nanoarchaeia archaeon]
MMKYEPMLAENGNLSLLNSTEHVFEPKMDGSRCILEKRGRRVYMLNRIGQDISYIFPRIKQEVEEYQEEFVLDGEIICYNENGMPDHRLLMRREQAANKMEIDMRANAIPATLVVFDVLELNNKKLTNEPIEERKKILRQLIHETPHVERIIFTEEGNALWDLIKKNKMEGVMAKVKKSKYHPGERTNDWIKIKNGKSIDAVVIGYTTGKSRNVDSFNALILGLYKKGTLIKVGKVETGWDDEASKYILAKMTPLKTKEEDKVQLLKPELVCEIDYLELTKEKELRAPVFKRLRHKPADKCTWAQLE